MSSSLFARFRPLARNRADSARSVRRRHALAPVLEQMERRALLATFTVVNTDNAGAGSLRAQLRAAGNGDTVDFNIPLKDAGYQKATDTFRISLKMALPAVTKQITIDATTQPDMATGKPVGMTRPVIEIDGSGVPAGENGLVLRAGSTTVLGLVINGFKRKGAMAPEPGGGNGIVIAGGTGDKIQGCYIGTDVTGTKAVPNQNDGILINRAAGNTDHIIGGKAATTGAFPGNVISGNGNDGIDMIGVSVKNVSIQGNLIGVDKTGLKTLPNIAHGVEIEGGSDNTIGAAAAGQGNVIGGNGGNGVQIARGPAGGGGIGNQVIGNLIGVSLDAKKNKVNVGNTGAGVNIDGGADQSKIQKNTITNNGIKGGKGGVVNDAKGTTIEDPNSIYGNGGPGIDNSPTAEFPDPNDLLAPPVLNSATASGTGIQVSVTINSDAATTAYPLTLEFFDNDVPGPDGKRFLGNAVVSAPGTFSVSLPAAGIVTATATDSIGNTSDFSQYALVTPFAVSDPLVVVNTAGFRLDHTSGLFFQTVTLVNTGPAIVGPVALVLDGLSANASLTSLDGTTSFTSPTDDPFVVVDPVGLDAGASETITLEFSDPTNQAITYTARVLAGSGAR